VRGDKNAQKQGEQKYSGAFHGGLSVVLGIRRRCWY